MNVRSLMSAVLLCGGAALFFTGCNETESVTPEGNTIVYKYDKSSPVSPDTAVTASSTSAPKASEDQKEWAERYDQQIKQREEAKKKAAAAKAERMRAALAKKGPKPTANPDDMKAAEAFVNSVKGSIKKSPSGAIIGLTMAASAAAAEDAAAEDAAENAEEGEAAPAAINLTKEDMELIGKLTDLETISFEGSAFNDDTCAPLANLKKLKSVTINNANIQNATLEMLATLPELTLLDIRRDLKLENASLEILQKMPKLEELHAHYNKFTNSGMNKIAKVATLKFVDVRGCADVSDNGAKYLAKLPALEQVLFRFTITNAGVEHLAKAANLKYIEFQDCSDINAGAVPSFQSMPSLTGIRFFRCKGVDDATIEGLAQRQLERLELRDLNLSNAALAALKNQTGIKTAEFSELASVDAAGLTELLANLKGIDKITFFTIALNDEGIKNLVANNPNMKDLAARAVPIDDAAIDEILKLKNLVNLDLRSNNGITADGFLKLSEMKNLKKLYLKDTTITSKGNEAQLAELKAALPKTTFIQ